MASTDTSHRRHLMGDAAGDRKTDPKQRPTGVALPSSNTTARHMPRLSGQCYHLASLAHISKAERMPDFATAAYELLEASMGKVQAATGLQTLQQDGKTGKVSVSLTGGLYACVVRVQPTQQQRTSPETLCWPLHHPDNFCAAFPPFLLCCCCNAAYVTRRLCRLDGPGRCCLFGCAAVHGSSLAVAGQQSKEQGVCTPGQGCAGAAAEVVTQCLLVVFSLGLRSS